MKDTYITACGFCIPELGCQSAPIFVPCLRLRHANAIIKAAT